MAKQTINIGAAANDGTGDPIRTAFGKVNDNFTEIYTANTGVNTGDQNLAAYATTAAVAAGYQPLDSDLTAIAALTTTAYGRALLSTTDAPTLRTAIGLGQTDAPTFLAQSLTGQSLTGTQATSLVDLSATWNTIGNPSLIYGRVTNTNSGTTANLIDLGTFAGGSLFKVDKAGAVSGTANITGFGSNQLFINTPTTVGGILAITNSSNTDFIAELSVQNKIICNSTLQFGWGSQGLNGGNGVALRTSLDTILTRDAAGILAQRNGAAAQAFRVYNTFPGTGNNEWGGFDWQTTANTLRIGTDKAASGGLRPVWFVSSNDTFRFNNSQTAGQDTFVNISGQSGFSVQFIHTANSTPTGWTPSSFNLRLDCADEGFVIRDGATFRFGFSRGGLFRLGGTTSAFPAIKRNGTGIDIKLADDSAFAPIKGKITTDTNYTAGVPSATGYITIYDATGTAYRVPCTV
jgi:hypothetical protein